MRRLPAAVDRQAFWSSEVLTSKKPPAYLRLGSSNTRESAIDLGIKERLLDYPVSQLRKPSEVMEAELKQLRAEMSDAHSAKRKEARRHRRLNRKCRVKAHEDLEELEVKYPASQLAPMVDPAESVESRKRRDP